MRGKWNGLGLLLLVPWLTNCVAGPMVRLDTGQGPPIVYAPSASEPPPVEIRQEELVRALTDMVLHLPLSLSPSRREGRVVLASWGGSRDTAQGMLPNRCAPDESPEGCLVLPENAPPPETLARLRLALSFAMDTVWEGATVPISEYLDPLAFKVMVYTAMSTMLLALMMPEPVTKGLAAVLTLYLVAYLGLGPVWSMVKAGWRLLDDSKQATSPAELKAAGHRFGRVLGDNGMRVLLLLATAALGGQRNFVTTGPRLPGFRQAALASPARIGVSLEAAGQVRTVVLGAREVVVGLAPTAVAATVLKPGSGPSEESVLESADVAASVQWKGFPKGSLSRHYEKHVKRAGEFGGSISQSEYLRMAREFAAERSGRFQEKLVGNLVVKYDPQTRRVFVGHVKEREIRTFYQADGRTTEPFEAAVRLAEELTGR
jgi:hypothetical protein